MTTVLYIDILFLVNWMMDAVILILTGRFLRRRIRLWRVSAAAAAGALWVCLCAAFTPVGGMRALMDGLVQLISLIPVAAAMVWIAYPSKEFRELLRGWLCLYLTAVLIGGLIHVIYDNTALGRFWQQWMAGSDAEAISVWLLAGAMAGSFVAIECGLRYRSASRSREQIQDVTLYYQGRQRTVKALWDSGNQLYDPFTGRVVHIIEEQVGRDLLGEEMYQHVASLKRGEYRIVAKSDQPTPPISARLIPCRSLGSAHSLLPILSITRLELASGGSLEAPVIGLSSVPLSGDGSYQMLLHSQTDEKRRNL